MPTPETPVLNKFDISTHPSDGYIKVPLAVAALRRGTIQGLNPGDWGFVTSASVQMDKESDRLTIDVFDTMPEKPDNLKLLESRPAVMRVLRGIGSSALDGFVIDYRRVISHVRTDRGLTEGIVSVEFMEAEANYGAQLPLGAVFSYYGVTHYIGRPDVAADTLYLAQEVDRFVHHLEISAEPRMRLKHRPRHLPFKRG